MISLERRPMTLLEVLIVIALIGVIAGVIGWNISGMNEQQQFYAGVSQVVEKLEAAQEIMLIHNDDVQFILEKNDRGEVFASLKTDTPMSTKLGELITYPKIITGIRSFAFSMDEKGYSGDSLTLRFSAASHRTPKGVLTLSAYPDIATDGSLKSYIDMNGFPEPIAVGRKREAVIETFMESEELFPHEIRVEWERRQAEKENEEKQTSLLTP